MPPHLTSQSLPSLLPHPDGLQSEVLEREPLQELETRKDGSLTRRRKQVVRDLPSFDSENLNAYFQALENTSRTYRDEVDRLVAELEQDLQGPVRDQGPANSPTPRRERSDSPSPSSHSAQSSDRASSPAANSLI